MNILFLGGLRAVPVRLVLGFMNWVSRWRSELPSWRNASGSRDRTQFIAYRANGEGVGRFIAK